MRIDFYGPIYRVGTELADLMMLSIYWLIGCIPIITIANSTSALFYVYGKKLRGEDPYITQEFIKSYRQNFKQSILVMIILSVLWISGSFYFMMLFSSSSIIFSGIAMFLIMEVSLITIYSIAILSRYYVSTKNIFISSFVLAHKHILSSGLILGLSIIVSYIMLYVPILIIGYPAIIAAIHSYFIQKIFAKNEKLIAP
ncbi:hypothetical protein AN639_01660 [Candidatus Epulonipiscium fishelsonii]|uniref:Uncharacterized protein n=1 Tax=Candidatus Epulonipiscium fishelsonii TaxID=77094 RepID=A0ACC8XB89_9FIRM|nr:hypothetical protein AN639_01660 [Epulopiscium sp. SCG-B05WGA-EpuloA1]ONI39692.1 hypothetical protein AN396_07415 [Epulopiscium sp. SCG-B11WGA-EpuloA1]